MPAVPRTAEPPARDYVFAGPGSAAPDRRAVRRRDRRDDRRVERAPADGGASRRQRRRQQRRAADPPRSRAGRRVRARMARRLEPLTRALGRPIRDQVTSVRAARGDDAAGAGAGQRRVPDALAVARRAADARRAAARSDQPATTRAVAGRKRRRRAASTSTSRRSQRLWLVVAGHRLERAGTRACRRGPTPSSSGRPAPSAAVVADADDAAGVRAGTGPVAVPKATGGGVCGSTNPSVLVYDIAGKGFARFRGVVGRRATRATRSARR